MQRPDLMTRYWKRRSEYIEKLGGKCARCGSVENLQFDHIDPTTKEFNVSKYFAGTDLAKLEAEIEKCQLLCSNCHLGEKTVLERGNRRIKDMDVHGTLSSYRYCKCDICRKANSEWMRKYASETGLSNVQRVPPFHGTYAYYKSKNCRCDLCRAANTAYMKEYYKTHPKQR